MAKPESRIEKTKRLLADFKATTKQILKKAATIGLAAAIISSASIVPVFAHDVDAHADPKDKPKEKNSAFTETSKFVETDPSLGDTNETRIASALIHRMATSEANETTALIAAGGGTSGAISAGSACALHDTLWISQYQEKHNCDLQTALDALKDAQANGTVKADLAPAFDELLGSSVGNLVISYILSGNLYDGAAIFSQDLDDKFLSKLRVVEGLLTHGSSAPGMNLTHLENLILGQAGKEKTLDLAKEVQKLNAPGAPRYTIMMTDPNTFEPIAIPANGMNERELIETIIYCACNNIGIANPTNGQPFDAKYSGQTVPVTKSNADIKVVLDNQPVGHTGFDGKVAECLNQFVLICASNELGKDEKFERLMKAVKEAEAKNQQDVRNAQNDTAHNIFMGAPAGDPVLSSSEMDQAVLKDATERAYLNGMAKFIDAGIKSGEFEAQNGTFYLEPPHELGKPDNYLKVKVYPEKTVFKIVKSIPQKKPAKDHSKGRKTVEQTAAVLTKMPVTKEGLRKRKGRYDPLNKTMQRMTKESQKTAGKFNQLRPKF